jgi:hypothetical protein
MTRTSVTDRNAASAGGATHPLVAIARASGHELRNALNALVVNLEVVRTRVTDSATLPFVEQAVKQSEESARLAESSIALLNLVAGAVGSDGQFRGSAVEGNARIEAQEGEVERSLRSLKALEDRGAVRVDASGTTVILSIPEQPASQTTE